MIRLLSVALVLLLGSALRGEPPPGVKTIRLELEPTPSRAPVLRYPLLPELRDQKPGNAVPLYRKAAQTLKTAQKELGDPRWYERAQRWIEIPPDRLPRAEVQDFLDHHRGALAEVEDAARHEYADWELTEKIRNQGKKCVSSPICSPSGHAWRWPKAATTTPCVTFRQSSPSAVTWPMHLA